MKFFKNILIIVCISILNILGILTSEVVAQVPRDPLSKMEIAFEGHYTRSQIKQRLETIMDLYNLPKTQENYSHAGSALVALRKSTGQDEMNILDYMIRSYVPQSGMSFADMAAVSAVFLQAGDR